MLATAPAFETPVRSEPHDGRAPRLSTYVPPRLDPATAPVVLIAEDHEDSRDALRTLLDALGYRVLVATNGAEAVEVARAHRPDLILIDIKMPVMDGYETTTRLKADAATRAIPVIALTAHAMAEDRDRAVAAGVDEYESKPVDFARLLEKIGQLLAPGRGS